MRNSIPLVQPQKWLTYGKKYVGRHLGILGRLKGRSALERDSGRFRAISGLLRRIFGSPSVSHLAAYTLLGLSLACGYAADGTSADRLRECPTLVVVNRAFEDVRVTFGRGQPLRNGLVMSMRTERIPLCQHVGQVPFFRLHAIGGRWDEVVSGEGLNVLDRTTTLLLEVNGSSRSILAPIQEAH